MRVVLAGGHGQADVAAVLVELVVHGLAVGQQFELVSGDEPVPEALRDR